MRNNDNKCGEIMKTVIWGYWANNLGDDLFLESLINEFKPTSDNKYYLLTYKKYRQHYKEMGYLPICKDSFLYRAFGKITRRIFKCEPYFFACNKNTLFIILGGSLFAENKTEIEEQLQYNNLEYAIMHSFKSCIIGSNFGPFRTKDYLEKYRGLYSGTLVKTKIDKFLNVSGSRHCSIKQQCREVALCWRDVPDG